MIVAKVRRKAFADRTRGAWPQSIRALAEKISTIARGVLETSEERQDSLSIIAANLGGARATDRAVPDLERRTRFHMQLEVVRYPVNVNNLKTSKRLLNFAFGIGRI